MPLPQDLLVADAAFFTLHQRLVASRHLNPLDEVEARARFLAGGPVRFRYAPLPHADDLLRACDAVAPPDDHPLGVELAAAVAEVRAAVVALRDRTPQAFAALAELSGWWAADEMPAREPPVRPADPEVLPLADVVGRFEEALAARGVAGWTVAVDPVMTARVLADAPRRVLRLNPRASWSPTDVRALIAHEIDVHVARAVAGAAQPLRLFELGLAQSLVAEEGLALYAEAQACGLPAGAADRLALLAAAARRAAEQGFTGLYRGLEPLVGAQQAWTTCVRLKRGLADPETPGVYAKDRVYWLGWCRISRWVASGADLRGLRCGKVGFDHPVAAWAAEGWITLPG